MFIESCHSHAIERECGRTIINYHHLPSLEICGLCFFLTILMLKQTLYSINFYLTTFEELLKFNFPVQSPRTKTVLPIDYMETNAIRYVADYVFRSVKKKCMKSTHPLKDAIILYLSDIEEDI